MPASVSPSVREFVAETVAAAPPMSDGLREDLRTIIWGQHRPDELGAVEAA